MFRDVSVFRCSGVFQCSVVFRGVPGIPCILLLLIRSGVPVVVFRGVPVFRCSGVPVFRGVPMFLVLVHAVQPSTASVQNELLAGRRRLIKRVQYRRIVSRRGRRLSWLNSADIAQA